MKIRPATIRSTGVLAVATALVATLGANAAPTVRPIAVKFVGPSTVTVQPNSPYQEGTPYQVRLTNLQRTAVKSARLRVTPGSFVASSRPGGRISGKTFQITVGTLQPHKTRVVSVLLRFPSSKRGTTQLISGTVTSGTTTVGVGTLRVRVR